MKSTQFSRSAATLVGGLAAVAVGVGLVALAGVVGGEAGANGALVAVGTLAIVVGTVAALVGVWLLASNVDLAAKVAADVLASQESQARTAARGRSR